MSTLNVYDPAMCCSSGVCGPKVSSPLVEFAAALKKVEKRGINVQRYNLAQEPQAFVENKQVSKLLAELGKDGLPFIFINDELAVSGRYPTAAELFGMFVIHEKSENVCGRGQEGCG